MISLNLLIKTIVCLFNMQIGIATIFWTKTDPYNPVAWGACLKRDLVETDHVVAHPTLPCKSRVFIYNIRTGLSTVAIVGDRGPKNALVDLHIPVAKAIKLNGYEKVIFIPLPEI